LRANRRRRVEPWPTAEKVNYVNLKKHYQGRKVRSLSSFHLSEKARTEMSAGGKKEVGGKLFGGRKGGH